MSNKLINLVEQYNQFKTATQSLKDEEFKEYFAEFFDKYTNIKAIYLYGYVPSFNDGEPCSFSFRSPEVIFNDFDYSDILENNDFSSIKDAYGTIGVFDEYAYESGTVHHKICEELELAVEKIPSEIYNLVFGDNFHLTVTKSSLKRDDYRGDY